jgi:hypothetical protein
MTWRPALPEPPVKTMRLGPVGILGSMGKVNRWVVVKCGVYVRVRRKKGEGLDTKEIFSYS